MIFGIECKKLKRTGLFPALICSSLIASSFPVFNMLFRSESFTALSGDPFSILMDANWQMIAMINILFSVSAASMMYHIEYANNAWQKSESLPVSSIKSFICKFCITVLILVFMLLIETIILTACAHNWFTSFTFNPVSFFSNIGFQLVVSLPTTALILFISSVCKNMWVSLGINAILVFTLSIVPQENLILSMLPFCSPYKTLSITAENGNVFLFLSICVIETLFLCFSEAIFLNVRRRLN